MTTRGPDSALRSPTTEVLTEFILSLVQAFLRTGYYLPDHPQSKKAKVGLYNRFKSLFAGRHELTFMLKEMGETQNILVDGPLPETQRLSMLMTKGMAEVYVPRLAKFLERKELVSLTLKETMGEEEFSRFVDVMSEPTFQTLDSVAKNAFTDRLREMQITHISYVFNEDMVTDRTLPWRVQLSISRLKKDLKCIPLFQDLDEEGFRSLRKRVIHDVLRPINKPDLMAAILLNSDLARTTEVTEEEIEDEVISYVSAKGLVETGREALHSHLKTEEGREPEGRKRALFKLYLRLRSSETEGAPELVREFFDNRLIDFDSLPEELKKQIIIEKETDRFLEERSQMLKALETSPSAGIYQARSDYLLRIIPELVRRDLIDEALVLVTMFRGHIVLGGFRATIAFAALADIVSGSIGTLFKEKFLRGKKEDRIALEPIFQALGEPWIPHLMQILHEAEDTWVRKNACEALLKMGAEAGLLSDLKAGKFSVSAMSEIFMVFGEVECDSSSVTQILRQHTRHKQPKLREEAARALCRIRGELDEDIYLGLLDDPVLDVQKRAIRCLRKVKSMKALPRFMAILKRAEDNPELEPLAITVYLSLAEYPDAEIEPGVGTELFLLRLLKDTYPGGLRGVLKRSERRQLSGNAFYAVCETLGAIGTKASLEMLQNLSKRVRDQGRKKLQKSIQQIETRLHPQPGHEGKESTPATSS